MGLSLPGFLLALFWMFLGALVLRINVGGVMSAEFSNAPLSWAKLVDLWNHFWLPAVILGLSSTAQMQRIMRSSMLDVLNQQFITTARAKGLKESRVINQYGVRGHQPADQRAGAGGAQDYPRIGAGGHRHVAANDRAASCALQTQDMYLAGTFLLFMTFLLMLANLLADVVLAWVDPRIVYE
ncbi:MAG: ABC transporter permease [Caldilineaceae bacterium]